MSDEQKNIEKQLEADFAKLEVGQEIQVDTEDLPRVVEQFPAKGTEGEEDYESAYESEPMPISLNKPMTATIVALNVAPGKQVGIKLANAPKADSDDASGTRWFEAHECDGATEKGTGWYITMQDVKDSNPKLFAEKE